MRKLMGKRGIAGSMVFVIFDRSALYQIIHDGEHMYYRKEGQYMAIESALTETNAWWEQYATILDNGTVDTEEVPAEYLDQVMPFDCTLVAQNEYGLAAWMAILGIEILNEGGGLSVDDITNEEQCTYVCRSKTPWIPWNTEENQFDLDSSSLPQGTSSVKVLHPPGDEEGITFEDLENVYTSRETTTGG